mmetsp:Transcript_22066/g.72828  ORF Transcript_22066/g.72828 Transcript_22066/m.72828 type:complete len:238 (+) Transcript_22066:804-1517(+)
MGHLSAWALRSGGRPPCTGPALLAPHAEPGRLRTEPVSVSRRRQDTEHSAPPRAPPRRLVPPHSASKAASSTERTPTVRPSNFRPERDAIAAAAASRLSKRTYAQQSGLASEGTLTPSSLPNRAHSSVTSSLRPSRSSGSASSAGVSMLLHEMTVLVHAGAPPAPAAPAPAPAPAASWAVIADSAAGVGIGPTPARAAAAASAREAASSPVTTPVLPPPEACGPRPGASAALATGTW